MKSKNLVNPPFPVRALYSNPLFRKTLHSVPVSRLLSYLPPRTCGRMIGRLLLPYVATDRLNVLSISRELLSKDTEQIALRTGINFIPWRSGHLARLISRRTPKVCQVQTSCIPEEHYRNHPCWTAGTDLLAGLMDVLQQKAPVPVMLTANVDYWQEEPVRRFCAQTETTHLVLDRENHMVKEYRDHMRLEFAKADFSFGGHAAVFSQRMKDLLIETSGCRPNQVTVTGAPRMDVWLDERPVMPKDTVTFLSFHTCLIPGMFDNAVDIYIDTARRHPELQFVIKCKEGRGDYGRMKKKFAEVNAPANLRPEQHINMRDLMDRSRVIIGFNTLSLAEALLTDSTLIIPSWNVTADSKHLVMMDPDDPELAAEIQFPRSTDQFREQLEKALTDTPKVNREARLKLTNRYMLFTPGESSSERVANLIYKLTKT